MRFLRKTQLQLLWMYEKRGKTPNIVAGMVEENPDISKLSLRKVKILSCLSAWTICCKNNLI